ncbi:MAG: class I SAM-dependent methyltransferase [Methanoregula sp.]|nr:class I SAM-dependent methyltransferase [Methanoregula sp.]
MPGPDNTSSHNSGDYDHQIRMTIPHYDDIHEEILHFVKSQDHNPGTWLDTGCGTGSFIRKAQAVFPETEFFITDPSVGMLAKAVKTLDGCRYSLLGRYGTGDLPGVTDRRFDVITAIQCHHYLSQKERGRAVRACHTLLKDGGYFITSENIRPFSDEGIARSLSYWGSFQRAAGRSEKEVRNHLARFDKEYFPITVTGHLQCYRDAGFAVAEILWLSGMQGAFWCRK